jgi:hypothetical protein
LVSGESGVVKQINAHKAQKDFFFEVILERCAELQGIKANPPDMNKVAKFFTMYEEIVTKEPKRTTPL